VGAGHGYHDYPGVAAECYCDDHLGIYDRLFAGMDVVHSDRDAETYPVAYQ